MDKSTEKTVYSPGGCEFALIRSKRRTAAIYIRPGGRVEVRAPLGMARRDIDRFVDQKAGWIAKHAAASAASAAQRQAFRVEPGRRFLWLGVEYPAVYRPGCPAAGFDGGRFLLPSACGALNRPAMVDEIVTGMKLHVEEQFTTIHNYIDTDAMILRKGAVSAQAGEQLLIPINMRDGSLLCVGKGNEDWNCSAPHGAGRLMSRADAKQSFTVSEFKKQMAEVYTTSVSRATLDECPMAYKGIQDILDNIGPTADVVKIIRPIYNFKAGDGD